MYTINIVIGIVVVIIVVAVIIGVKKKHDNSLVMSM